MNASDENDDRLSLTPLYVLYFGIFAILCIIEIILSILKSFGVIGPLAYYTCFCIISSFICLYLFFSSDRKERLGYSNGAKKQLVFFHLLFWPSLPLSLPLLIVAILIASIFNKLIQCTFSSPKSENGKANHSIPKKQVTTPSKEFRICHTIWLCTYHISRHCGFSNNTFAQGHVWATLLYITAKHIRDQAVVDHIYSHFESAASDVADGDPFPKSILSLIRYGYKQFAPILNSSGIDPRTPDGIHLLWDLLKKEDFKYKDPHPSATQAYFDYTQILISNLTTYHKADQ